MAAGSQEGQQRSVVVRETVELTEVEERIFQRLLDVVRHFGLGTQLRIAGGWVRDKVTLFTFFFPPCLFCYTEPMKIPFSRPVGCILVPDGSR